MVLFVFVASMKPNLQNSHAYFACASKKYDEKISEILLIFLMDPSH
jgi:hypothetical protein